MCSESVSPAYVWRLVAHAFCMEVLMNNPMKEAPVNKLMLKMGTPIILSMMMQALYNIVDSAFVSNMGANGEMALNAGPQSLVISILRQFVLVIPVAFVFSNLVIAGTTFKSIIWFTFIIAEMLTALIGYFMLNRIVKNSLTFRAI